ncbi:MULTISPECIES: Mth938-like domain-containing protein [Shimia]|uniref:Mth938-like domain-containing protein n=1 Tax=Shimia TaxID=573139 RepID=UPI001FB47B92|nr:MULTISPECIES: Mth938-like domain-containing protein [Shimia]MDV4145534.1 Mth938-like domain-containing protein [Shimia sp. FJ5]
MKMSEVQYDEAVPIEGYGPGFFRVGGEIIEGGAIIHATGARSWQGYDDLDSVLALGGKVDVILMGTGETMAPIPATFKEPLEAAGIGVEPMASASACRTYNVLVSEGRRVAAVVLPVGAAD